MGFLRMSLHQFEQYEDLLLSTVESAIFIISFFPQTAPMGSPPPIILPKVKRSGSNLNKFIAPSKANLNPVTISSRMKRLPFLFANSCNPSRYPSCGVMHPAPPKTGSTITAARSSFNRLQYF